MSVMDPSQSSNRSTIPVIDYEGSQYQTDFWDGQGREYEDSVERIALQQLVPKNGQCIAEIGAGFGRLADLYLGYEQIILFDYSRTLLQDAATTWGDDPRFVFVAGNIYELPLATGLIDTIVMMRVMHHLADVPSALHQIERVLHEESVGVLEYANKRNLKSILRWYANRQEWSPFDQEPLEFVELNFDFHPTWMQEKMVEAELLQKQQFALSHFRLPSLKRTVPAQFLARIDSLLFRTGGLFPVAPSVLIQVESANRRAKQHESGPRNLATLFRCPHCQAEAFEQIDEEALRCTNCGKSYARQQQVWDFKEAMS